MGELPRFPGFQRVFEEIVDLSLREITMSYGDPNVVATHWAFSNYIEKVDGINYFDIDKAVADLQKESVLLNMGAYKGGLLSIQQARMKAIRTMLMRYGDYSQDRIAELIKEVSGSK